MNWRKATIIGTSMVIGAILFARFFSCDPVSQPGSHAPPDWGKVQDSNLQDLAEDHWRYAADADGKEMNEYLVITVDKPDELAQALQAIMEKHWVVGQPIPFVYEKNTINTYLVQVRPPTADQPPSTP